MQNPIHADIGEHIANIDARLGSLPHGSGNQGTQGNQGLAGSDGSIGVQGNVGSAGVQGFQGGASVPGVQGYQGLTGVQGNQGNQGWQGNQGNQGFTGVQGNQGNQGNQGFTGVQGNQGNQGWQGNQGNQGFTGVQGNQGNQGWQGNQGNQGRQGNQGNQGFTGVQGNQGNQGNQGLQGSYTGTVDKVAKFTSTNVIGNSNIWSHGNIDGFTLTFLESTGELLVGWNRSSGEGETDLISNRGAGYLGGFAFYDINNSGTLTQLAKVNTTGLGIGVNPVARLDVAGTTVLGPPGRTLITDNGSYEPTLRQYKWSGTGYNYLVGGFTTQSDGNSPGGGYFRFGVSTGGAVIGSESIIYPLALRSNGDVEIGQGPGLIIANQNGFTFSNSVVNPTISQRLSTGDGTSLSINAQSSLQSGTHTGGNLYLASGVGCGGGSSGVIKLESSLDMAVFAESGWSCNVNYLTGINWGPSIVNPTISQSMSAGNGTDLNLNAQSSVQSGNHTGGNLYLAAGVGYPGSANDGIIGLESSITMATFANSGFTCNVNYLTGINWGSAVPNPTISQSMATGNGTNLNINAQSSVQSGTHTGGNLYLSAGIGYPGNANDGIIGLESSVTMATFGTAGWNCNVFYLSNIYFGSSLTGPTIKQGDATSGAGNSLSIIAQTAGGGYAGGNGGDLILQSGDNNTYAGTTPGNVFIIGASNATGKIFAEAKSLNVTRNGVSGGQHCISRPSSVFPVITDVAWVRTNQSNGSTATQWAYVTSVYDSTGLTDNSVYSIKCTITAKGGSMLTVIYAATFKKISGTLSNVEFVVLMNQSGLSCGVSAIDNDTMGLYVVPPNNGATTWTFDIAITQV